jgi:hypothetical protein
MVKQYVTFDITIPKTSNWSVDQVKDAFKASCRQWAFSEEKGETTGYEHFQCRVKLKTRAASAAAAASATSIPGHWSLTSTTNSDNEFYVVKEDGRVSGPYTDRDREIYMPRQYRHVKDNLRPFQQQIWDSRDVFEPRRVNCVVDLNGDRGKSTIASYMECMEEAIDMPPCNDGEKLVQSLCDLCVTMNTRNPKVIFIDLPRSMDQKKLNGMYTAIEQIKKGKLYDFRYKYQVWWIDSPQVWVFCNTPPSLGALTKDRWAFWTIDDEFRFVRLTNKQVAAMEQPDETSDDSDAP